MIVDDENSARQLDVYHSEMPLTGGDANSIVFAHDKSNMGGSVENRAHGGAKLCKALEI